MHPNDPNVAMMEVVAHRLGAELREATVSVGAAVVGLLITDPADPSIRPTEDVASSFTPPCAAITCSSARWPMSAAGRPGTVPPDRGRMMERPR